MNQILRLMVGGPFHGQQRSVPERTLVTIFDSLSSKNHCYRKEVLNHGNMKTTIVYVHEGESTEIVKELK